jgi:LmbE family N-acetylglucosaminyl deacetylase
MVVGAHAADAELMGGGAILSHVAQGWRAVIVHLSLGEKGHKSLDSDAFAEVKRGEAERAAALLGADVVMLGYRDGEIPVSEGVQWDIADAIRAHRPTAIVTHWRGSLHQDHINCYQNVLASLFFAGLRTFVRKDPAHYPRAVLFGENWEDEEGFEAETYLDVSQHWEHYRTAVLQYGLVSGEAASFRYLQWYDGMSRVRGAERGVDRAVALMPHRTMYTRRRLQERLI